MIYTTAQEKAMREQAQKVTTGYYNPTDHIAKENPMDRKQSPALFIAIVTLEKAVHELRESLEQLGERLLPIIYPTPIEESPPVTRGLRTGSPISERLHELEAVIDNMNRSVLHQLDSMDL